MRELENISTTQLWGILQLIYQENTVFYSPAVWYPGEDWVGNGRFRSKFLALLETSSEFASCGDLL